MQRLSRDRRLAHRSFAAFSECVVSLVPSRPRNTRSRAAIDDKGVSGYKARLAAREPEAEFCFKCFAFFSQEIAENDFSTFLNETSDDTSGTAGNDGNLIFQFESGGRSRPRLLVT
jgi:hypothetical protein